MIRHVTMLCFDSTMSKHILKYHSNKTYKNCESILGFLSDVALESLLLGHYVASLGNWLRRLGLTVNSRNIQEVF